MAVAGMCQGSWGSRHRGSIAAITRSGRTMTVSAGLDARTASACGPAACSSPARRTSIQPASGSAAGRPAALLIRTRTRPCRRQKSASPASGRRAGQHGGASGQDRVQPDRRAVVGGHQRVGEQAAGPQRGGDAGREEAPRGVLQGAGLQPRRRGGAHGLADPLAADRRGQGDPADGGGAVLAAGHRPADPDGLFHQGRGVRAAFAVVGVEQVLPGPAGEHVGELPGQVVGVAQPARQALADERRGEVGGVTQQEDPPAAEAGCHLGAEGVGRAADDLQAVQVAAPGPGPQQLAEGGRGDQVGFVLAVAQPELPAVPVAGDLHEGGGAGGVADLLDAVPGVQAGRWPGCRPRASVR